MSRLCTPQEWAAPILAIAVVAASVFVTVTARTSGPGSAGMAESSGHAALGTDFWEAAAPVFAAPVELGLLAESLERQPAWVETRMVPGDIAGQSGKLVVVRHFGLSEDKDATHVVQKPASHLEKVAVGFQPFDSSYPQWQWAWFTPQGEALQPQTDDHPPTLPTAPGLLIGQCDVPASLDIPVSG